MGYHLVYFTQRFSTVNVEKNRNESFKKKRRGEKSAKLVSKHFSKGFHLTLDKLTKFIKSSAFKVVNLPI